MDTNEEKKNSQKPVKLRFEMNCPLSPLEKGLGIEVEDYVYSSACDFAGLTGLLDIVQTFLPTEKIPLMWTVR